MALTKDIDVKTIQSITPELAWHYMIVPQVVMANSLEFAAIEQNINKELLHELEIVFGKNIVLHPHSEQDIRKELSLHYRRNSLPNKGQEQKARFEVNDSFLLKTIKEAESIGCSDIHFESYESNCRIRFRIDGHLIERYEIAKQEYLPIVNQIKIEANLDIAEKRLPQDGRILIQDGKRKTDIRVSLLPTLFGEKVVLRILNKDATNIDIGQIGLTNKQKEDYLRAAKHPHGIVLISGPTGSGKTTTLYATLKLLNKVQTNILTIEDPVEYTLEGINQVQLREDIGLGFAKALRTFLRQDPDIIMLGEIRDKETAQMAIRAALTGHLVLSTIHTNSAWGTISRLADMDIPPFLIEQVLRVSVAQRLVRLLCPNCKEETQLEESLLPDQYKKHGGKAIYKACGCEDCYYTGYKGRRAIFEVIPINKTIAKHISNETTDIKTELQQMEVDMLSDGAMSILLNGESSYEEVASLLFLE